MRRPRSGWATAAAMVAMALGALPGDAQERPLPDSPAAPGQVPGSPAPDGAGAATPQPSSLPATRPATTARQDNAEALRLLRQGRAEEAAALFAHACAKSPQNAEFANNLGHVLAKLGRQAEAEAAYRTAIKQAPTRWLAYAGLADLWARDPRRWDRRGELVALLEGGLRRLPPGSRGRVTLALRIANLERSVGRVAAARRRLLALRGANLSGRQRRRLQALLAAIDAAQRTGTFDDWPEPPVPPAARGRLAQAERALQAGDGATALATSAPLVGAHPAWRALRWLRARAYDSVGRFDDAARELTVLVRLAPSHAAAWRRLGQILVTQGGALEAERADVALRHALALEPSWSDLWLLRARTALRRGRPDEALRIIDRLTRGDPRGRSPAVARLRRAAETRLQGGATPTSRPAPIPEPSPAARQLYDDAQEWLAVGDPLEMAGELLRRTLRTAPTFIDAAVAYYGITGTVPPRTVEALWSSGDGLLELAAKIRAAHRDDDARVRELVRPWLDQAVTLGAVEAYFQRAVIRAEERDHGGATDDLVQYLARAAEPRHLEEARALRRSLVPPPRHDPAILTARLRLLEDRPQEALSALGGRCAAKVPRARLMALGSVHEFAHDLDAATRCYRLALAASPAARAPLERLAGIGARASLPLPRELVTDLRHAAATEVLTAEWALARHLAAAGEPQAARPHLARFLQAAAPDSLHLEEARQLLAHLDRATTATPRRSPRPWIAAAAAGGALLILLLGIVLRGQPVARAVRSRPALFPDVARAVAELRHDVIKHRCSVLSLLGGEDPPREEITRALTTPTPASRVVAEIYARLRQAARGHGVTLRSLRREPVFGALHRDLRRAEAWAPRPDQVDALLEVDRRLREEHSEHLARLLRLGPRTRLDAAALAEWIRSVEAEMRRTGGGWTPPAIQLDGLETEFPVERKALATIFTNLLRNAQAAVHDQDEPRVLVRVADERDATGRRLLALFVGDTAPQQITLESFESRESGRGLALVRDLTREWRGHVVVRAVDPPWTKAVGACFPA